MLFEFRGKVYEVNDYVLILLGVLASLLILYLIYIFVVNVILPLNIGGFFPSIIQGGSSYIDSNDDSYVDNSNINNPNLNANNSEGFDSGNIVISNKDDNLNNDNLSNLGNYGSNNKEGGLHVAPIPKEALMVISSNPDATDVEICDFNGHGRIALLINNKFNCRKTEDLKIITLKDRKIYCCVTP